MFGVAALKLLLGNVWEKAKPYVLEFIKWAVLALALLAAAVLINNKAYDRGYNVAESACTLQQQKAENVGTEKIITKERTVTQYVKQTTDSDLRGILDFWMRPAPAQADNR